MIDDDTKHRIAHAFVGGLIDGDLDRMRSVLVDSATWSLPGGTAVSGTARGADAVIARGDAVLDEHLTTVFRLDGERIVEIETLISDVPMLDAFFAADRS